MCMMTPDPMAPPVDIARLLLERAGPVDTARLHKFLYYVQAWSLAQRDAPAFGAPIKAWVNGPVVSTLWAMTQGRYKIGATDMPGDSAKVSSETRAVADLVLGHYGKRSTDFLMALAHFERPWLDARNSGKGPNVEISTASMRAYFKGRTPQSIEAEYHMHVAEGVERDYEDALRLLAQ